MVTARDGEPLAVTLRGTRRRVLGIQDRWRIDDEWWRQPIARMYFVLAIEGDQLVTIFHDLIADSWFLQHAGAPKAVSMPLPLIVPRRPAARPAQADDDAVA